MVKGTFILSAHIPKTEHQKQIVKTRSTNMRYAVVVLAIAVVFVYEYCFDNPSVPYSAYRLWNKTSKQATIVKIKSNSAAHSLTYYTQFILFLMSLSLL